MAIRGYTLTTQAIERPSWTLYPGLLIAAALLALAVSVLVSIFNTGINSGLDRFDFSSLTRIILFTTLQASLSTIISLVLGAILAWSLSHRRQFAGRKLLIALLSLSMVLPSLVVAFGLISVLGRNGWVNQVLESLNLPGFDSAIYGLTGILIAHETVMLAQSDRLATIQDCRMACLTGIDSRAFCYGIPDLFYLFCHRAYSRGLPGL